MQIIMSNGQAYFGEEYEYGISEDELETECSIGFRPTIVIMGLKRSGKTSIRKVVFQKMSPNETLFVESTARVTNECIILNFFLAIYKLKLFWVYFFIKLSCFFLYCNFNLIDYLLKI